MVLKPSVKKALKIILLILVALAVITLLLFWIGKPQKQITWGLTFSTIRAEELGYNPRTLFTTILDDMRPKKVRIPIYWSEVEPQQGLYDFSKVRSLVEEANERGTEVVLVVGKKQPRWPECHQPDWYNHLNSEKDQDEALLRMIETTVTHFKRQPSVVAWQVENEAYFQYGPRCPVTSKELYEQELALVKALSGQPTIATDSGEKGMWVNVAWSGADILGTTMYREVYHDKKEKYLTYPLPWWTYNVKAGLVKLLSKTEDVIGMELQAEPWLTISNPNATPPQEQLVHMNPDIFQNNMDYARKVGLPENYLWGAEWWYWMRDRHGDATMVQAAKEFFNNN